MSVRKRDRHMSRTECLNRARNLVNQVAIITRPRIENDDGTSTKPGILGVGQAYYSFGADLFKTAKLAHAKCYQALQIKIKKPEDNNLRHQFLREALDACDSIFRQLDLCIFMYGRTNKKKMNSLSYIGNLTRALKVAIQDRMNLDNLIVQHMSGKK